MQAAETPAAAYARWLNETARALRAGDRAPATASEARTRAAAIRRAIIAAERDAWIPQGERAPLEPQVLGTLDRDGYRIERLIFQTRPGCFATATVYVPTAGKPPYPAVLNVHGHWAGARRDPVVQSRCIGLAKLGFLALTLDAWGAGERGTHPGQNEYHGGLLGASLWPVSTPLHGLQLNDNVRALDYLESRPDVDRRRIGCTGASGGGNQTTHLSAFDERIRCAVPVCSVGTFASYFTAASCVDEVLLGGLTFAEEGDLLGMVAPRALMVVTASRDAYHFGPEAAREALDRARPFFGAHGAEEKLRHAVFDSGHDYSRAMREAMYGWMRRWLQDRGDGSPVPEPEIRTEDPAALACFEPSARPAKVMTTVAFVRERAQRLTATLPPVPRRGEATPELDRRWAELRRALRLPDEKQTAGGPVRLPGVPPYQILAGGNSRPSLVLLLHPGGTGAAAASGLVRELRARQANVALVAMELRGCGELALPKQALGGQIPDHNLVEWSLWLDRPLLGQWVEDVLRILEVEEVSRLGYHGLGVVGWREGGLAALCAAALRAETRKASLNVAALETLGTFVTDAVPHGQRMAVFQPDLLRAGDVPVLAGLAATRASVLVADPLRLDGSPVPAGELDRLFRWPRQVAESIGRPYTFTARTMLLDADVAKHVEGWRG